MLKSHRPAEFALLASTFVIATCGLIYELLAGTISSYLLGDSVYQFSIVIGLFMAAMGLGSFFSRYVRGNPEQAFVWVQVAIAVIGGASALILFAAFTWLDNYTPVLVIISVSIGALVGVEIPLVIRILRDLRDLRLNVSNVLTADYIGALAASLLFPLVLVPLLGLVHTALLFGFMNLVVAALGARLFQQKLRNPWRVWTAMLIVLAGLTVSAWNADRAQDLMESRLYSGEIIYSAQTPYQRLTVTRDERMIKLFINGALQFNSLDEYRYHETLVHPAMMAGPRHDKVLILGGGDGMALREVLKYPDVKSVTTVDLDPEMTRMFTSNPLLAKLNGRAFHDPRSTVVNEDAARFLQRTDVLFDVVIIDLPDPHNLQLSRLYSRSFYQLAANRLAATGVLVSQATSPMFARQAYWCIVHTVAAAHSAQDLNAELETLPAHVYVPSFGEWGFVLAAARRLSPPRGPIPVTTRFLNEDTLAALWSFPPDMGEMETEINTIRTHRLVKYYESGWSRWYR